MYAVQDPFTYLPHDCEIAADGSLVMFVSTYKLAKREKKLKFRIYWLEVIHVAMWSVTSRPVCP
jgi:hypothetical protein